MALPSSYLVTTRNVEAFFNAVINAQAPEKVTQKFLENLEFKSTNDRLFIGVLKSLGLIDEAGSPTERYYQFLDQTQSKSILANAIRETYADLFATNKSAHELSVNEVKNKLKTLTQGQKTDRVLTWMANTFKALVDSADWSIEKSRKDSEADKGIPTLSIPETKKVITENNKIPSLNYNIEIHLPETRDAAVYDAIFKSLKDHLI